MQKLLKLWLPVFTWAALIFCFSNTPSLESDFDPFIDFILRKIAHMTEYFILVLLLRRAFKYSFDLNDLELFIYPVILSILYAVSDEFHQTFISGRHGCLRDVLIDSVEIFGFYFAIKLSGFFKASRRG